MHGSVEVAFHQAFTQGFHQAFTQGSLKEVHGAPINGVMHFYDPPRTCPFGCARASGDMVGTYV